METEIVSFMKVWITAISSMCMCYYIIARIPAGILRLLSLLPIIFIFILLPFNLSSFLLAGPTVFYLVWLANFKLLLFSFDYRPLSSQPPLPLLHFISVALFPIKIKQDPSLQTPPKNTKDPSPKMTPNVRTNGNPRLVLEKSENPYAKLAEKVHKSALVPIDVVLLAVIMLIYDYRQHLHPLLIFTLYICTVYLGLELTLAITAVLVRTFLGVQLEPQFNEPYLATSLQDFWGRRWNLMVSNLLRTTVYLPVRRVATRVLGDRWGLVSAYLAAFLVSGLMHEAFYFYWTRVAPTWEVTCFFVLHGVCTAAEVSAKKALAGEWRLHTAGSGPLTLGFLWVTVHWLLFPQVIRNGLHRKAMREYWVLVSLIKGWFV